MQLGERQRESGSDSEHGPEHLPGLNGTSLERSGMVLKGRESLSDGAYNQWESAQKG